MNGPEAARAMRRDLNYTGAIVGIESSLIVYGVMKKFHTKMLMS